MRDDNIYGISVRAEKGFTQHPAGDFREPVVEGCEEREDRPRCLKVASQRRSCKEGHRRRR